MNKTNVKPHVAAAVGRKTILNHAPNTYRWDLPDIIKFHIAAHTILEKAIWFQHLDYNLDRAQKLISSSMSRYLLTCNISSKSMYTFLSNLAYRQTDRQTDKRMRANAFTSSFVEGNNTTLVSNKGAPETVCFMTVMNKVRTTYSNIKNSLDDHAGPRSISELSALPASLVSFRHASSAIINNT